MRKLIVSNAMSLDGYYSGRDGNVTILELRRGVASGRQGFVSRRYPVGVRTKTCHAWKP